MSISWGIITQDVDTVTGIKCDNCEREIPKVWTDGIQEEAQGKNMLHVFLSGVYGEYIDGDSHIHLCGDCAKKLREAFPLFSKVLDATFTGGPDWRNYR